MYFLVTKKSYLSGSAQFRAASGLVSVRTKFCKNPCSTYRQTFTASAGLTLSNLDWLLTYVDFICMLSADSSRPLVHTMDGSALVKDSRATNCQSGRAQIIRITSNKDDRLGLLIFAGVVIFELLFTTHMIGNWKFERLWHNDSTWFKLCWQKHCEPKSKNCRWALSCESLM